MKKLFPMFFVCMLILLSGASAYAADDSGMWEYTSYGSGVELTAYNGTQTDVYVPGSIEVDGEKLSVIKLGDNLFSEKDGLNSVTLGEGITEIGTATFVNSTNLVCIVTPESLTTIGENAFSGCTSFNSIILLDAVTSIGENAFKDCSKVKIYGNSGSYGETYATENGITFIPLSEDAEPEIYTVDGIEYYIMNGEAIAISFDGSTTEVVIPATIEGYPVTELRETFKNHRKLASVQIPNSVKDIGTCAFYYCMGLTSIEIPDSVTYIGDHAFAECQYIVDVELPTGIINIDKYTFYNCIKLADIHIPEGVTNIGVYAFARCESLVNVEIPDSVTNIGDYIFQGCSKLESVKISNNLSNVSNSAFSGCSSLLEIEIPISVTAIGTSAFSKCISLGNVEIPESVIEIGSSAFSGCSNLVKVQLSEKVTEVGGNAFPRTTIWCVYENSYAHTLAVEKGNLYFIIGNDAEPQIHKIDGISYYIMNDEAIAISADESVVNAVISSTVEGAVVTELRETFKEHTQLESVVIPNGVISIGDSAFSGCTGLTSVEISDSVTHIGNYAFYNCGNLVRIDMPDSITNIGAGAFSHCKSLTCIKIPYGVTSIEHSTFNSCSKLIDIEIADSVTNIGSYAFQYCTSLENISIPKSVINIDYKAFEGCSSITDIVIPNGVNRISSFAFASCTNLSNVNIPDSVVRIYDYAFYNCSNLTDIVIPDSVKTIDSNAFKESNNLTKVKIPASVTIMYNDSFPIHVVLIVYEDSYAHSFATNNGLLYFAVTENEDEPEIHAIDAITYCVLNGKAIAIAADSALTDTIIPAEVDGCPVTELRGTFKNLKNLENVEIPYSVTTIGDYAFYGCTKLTDIKVPDGVTSIGSWAFASSGIKNIVLPNGITSIKNNAFFSSELICIELPNTITSIGDAAFSYCSELTSIAIPDGVMSIGAGTFRSCKKLESVKIPDSVECIGGYAFYDCTNLEKIIVPDSITTIGGYAFYNCVNLTTLKVPESVGLIYDDALPDTSIILVCENSYAHTFAVENDLLYFVLQKVENPDISYGSGISGTVAYTDGTAALGATVEIIYDDGTVKETVTTDETGAYSFTYAEVGRYTIRVKDSSGNTGSETVFVKRMNVFDVFLAGQTDITLKKGYTVSGSVSPAGSATVTLTDNDGNVVSSVETTDGSFSIADVHNGTYILKAETESGTAVQEITVFNGDVAGITLAVESESAIITGYVEVEDRDKNHHRRNWVHVTIYNSEGVAVASQKTDADGKYIFENLPLGEYSIVAETTEMRPDKHKHFDRSHTLTGYAYVNAAETATYEVETIILYEENEHLATISGKVTANGENQDCQVILSNVFRHEVAECRTGKNGKYTFTNVRDGLYFVTAVTESNGIGFAVVVVRNGKVYGITDIKVTKAQKIHDREKHMKDNIPYCEGQEDAIKHRDKIAEEKRYYDGLSEKEKKQFSKEYRDRLEKLCQWISDCINTGNGGTLENGSMILSEEELNSEDTFEIVLDITESTETEIGEDGIKNRDQYIQQSIHDTAGNRNIVKYYDISLTKKDSQGNSHKITSIAKDTDTTGKVRITMDIPEEYRGHKHYHFVHVHNGVATTLTDIDDDPNTITFEVDRFSTFALTYTDEELAVDGELEVEEETEEADNFGTRNACIRAMLNDNTKCQVTLLAGIDSLKYTTVGFEVAVGETTRQFDTKTVYTSVSALSAEKTRVSVAPADFGGNSQYIFGVALSFGEAFKDETLIYRPYAVDFEGNYIYGKESTISPIFKQ